MPARVLTRPALLMTMTDIAELADKPRPLITTWRRVIRTPFPLRSVEMRRIRSSIRTR